MKTQIKIIEKPKLNRDVGNNNNIKNAYALLKKKKKPSAFPAMCASLCYDWVWKKKKKKTAPKTD